jgi:carbonic anhydrase
MPDRDDSVRLGPDEALLRLVQGNRRFVADEAEHPDQTVSRRAFLGGSQHPFAAVFSCADSRVPPEIVFDAGLGDLFVVRSAGHVLDHAILGTLEFGVDQLGCPLLVVLGHTGCGAVRATFQAVTRHTGASGTDIDTLVEAITPAVVDAGRDGVDDDHLVDAAVRHNVERVVADVVAAPLVAPAVARGAVLVVGAVYDLSTGVVELVVTPGGVPLPAAQQGRRVDA